jgi:CubicO group peptidase (beta-lactamase class C family)
MLAFLAAERYKPLGPPGRYFSYSNEAFGLLGAVIERVTGRTYESYLEQNILRPAGMRHTTFDTGIMLRSRDVTTLYSPKWTGRRHGLVPSQDWWEDTCLRACGALRSNIEDMLRYTEIYRTEGKVGRERIVRRESVRRMLHPHAWIEPGLGYGYGVAIVPDFHGTKVVMHSGGMKGVASVFAALPEKGITGVVLCNAEGAPAETILVGGINALLGVPFKTPLLEYPPRPGKPVDLRPYAGWYCSGEGIWAHIIPRRGHLRLDFHGIELISKGLRFRTNGPDEFVKGRGANAWPLRFERDDHGRLWAASLGWRLVRLRSRAELRRAATGQMVW